MPFSRYQIRNEFSLADPELYKAADKDDPEALLEGVAMAGLVGVLRQLGDLAEFAAEIFHGLHEEVMVTATRGHGLLVRVQQLESDFPAIERAFLSQTGHSAFFSSSGIGWHPNLQTEQNLITRGDLPRFVMDSYEECRGPPRLFLLDKFDVAGAGACLKRYTDPSFYKVEASSFEMRNTEAQRDKNVRKTKKKGSRWKNGETPDVFQPSHVKLHQLLLEERMQNGASEPARHVKLRKREIKFPFDTETGKGYMESLLSSPPEDKLVHEVPIRPGLQTYEGSLVNSPSQNGTPYESPTVDKTVSREHMNHMPENMPGMVIPESPENESGVNSGIEEDEVEEKHISVDRNHKADDVIADGYESDDVVSEGENYVDALATMESEIETETTEARANSDSNVEQLQSQFSESQSDDESGSIKKKMESLSDSESSTTSTDNAPHSVTFASTEIPFRPRISPNPSCVDEGVILEESSLKESGLSEMSSRNSVEENHIDPEAIIASTNTVDDPSSSNRQSEDGNSNSTLENSHVEEQSLGPSLEEVDGSDADVKPSEEISHSPDTCSLLQDQLTDDVLESKSDLVSYSSDDETETELNDKKTSSIESESIVANVDDDRNLHILEEEKELMQREPEPELESVVSVADDINCNEERTGITVSEDTESEEKKVEPLDYVEKDEDDDGASTTEVQGDNGSGVTHDSDEPSEESLISPESDSIPSAKKESTESGENKESIISIPSTSSNHSNTQFLDTIPTHENDVENPSATSEENLIVLEKTVENGDAQPDLDFQTGNNVPSFQSDSQSLDDSGCQSSHLDIVTAVSNQDVESESMNNETQKLQDPISEESSIMADLPQINSEINLSNEINYPLIPMFPAINMLPQLAPINLEEMPPLPPLPPMQWRMGKLPNPSLISKPDDGQQTIFPQISSQPSLENQKSEHVHEVTESSNHALQIDSSSHTKEGENAVKIEEQQITPQPPFNGMQMQPEIVSTSGDDERPNGIRPMKIQRPRTPLIDAVAAHDKSKLRKVSERAKPQVPEEEEREGLLQLRKVSERARPQIPKEEERDTLLEQIRAKSFNLKPAVQTRPSIQGPSTNLRVAAILEKANAIRQAFAGSDDDEDDDDSWSDS